MPDVQINLYKNNRSLEQFFRGVILGENNFNRLFVNTSLKVYGLTPKIMRKFEMLHLQILKEYYDISFIDGKIYLENLRRLEKTTFRWKLLQLLGGYKILPAISRLMVQRLKDEDLIKISMSGYNITESEFEKAITTLIINDQTLKLQNQIKNFFQNFEISRSDIYSIKYHLYGVFNELNLDRVCLFKVYDKIEIIRYFVVSKHRRPPTFDICEREDYRKLLISRIKKEMEKENFQI